MTYTLAPFRRPKRTLTETFNTLEEARAAAQRVADKQGDWVAVCDQDNRPIDYIYPSKR